MTWLSTCISEYIAFPFSLHEDFIAVQYFLKDLLASTLMLQRHTSWYLCTLQNPLFFLNFDLQSCYLFEMFNKSKTKLNNMGLIILTNLIINFKMIERSWIPCDLYFLCQYVTTVLGNWLYWQDCVSNFLMQQTWHQIKFLQIPRLNTPEYFCLPVLLLHKHFKNKVFSKIWQFLKSLSYCTDARIPFWKKNKWLYTFWETFLYGEGS